MVITPLDGNTPNPLKSPQQQIYKDVLGTDKAMPNVPISLFIAYLYEQLEIVIITAALIFHTYANFDCFEPKILGFTFAIWLYSFVVSRWVINSFNHLRECTKTKVQRSLRFQLTYVESIAQKFIAISCLLAAYLIFPSQITKSGDSCSVDQYLFIVSAIYFVVLTKVV